ncbi:DUF6233 domain-containing protein [Streptomyces sp. NPDC054904]
MGRHPARVHASGCTMGGKGWRMRALTWEAAVRALGVDQGPACPYCSPDAALGMLDWPASRRLEAWTVRRSSYTGSRRRAGGRVVIRIRGVDTVLGVAHSDADLIELLRRIEVPDPDELVLGDSEVIAWQGGRPHVYEETDEP